MTSYEPDLYVIKSNATADYEAYTGTEFEVNGAAITGKDITLAARPYLTGIVSLAGEPAAGLYIYLYKGNSYVASAKTDANGAYTFKALEKNTDYRLTVSGSEYWGEADVKTGDAGKTEKDLALAALTSFSGVVTFGDSPVPNINLTLTKGDEKYWAYTDNNGRYTFHYVPSEDGYTLSIAAGGEYEAYTEPIDLSGTPPSGDIELTAAVTNDAVFTFTGAPTDAIEISRMCTPQALTTCMFPKIKRRQFLPKATP